MDAQGSAAGVPESGSGADGPASAACVPPLSIAPPADGVPPAFVPPEPVAVAFPPLAITGTPESVFEDERSADATRASPAQPEDHAANVAITMAATPSSNPPGSLTLTRPESYHIARGRALTGECAKIRQSRSPARSR